MDEDSTYSTPFSERPAGSVPFGSTPQPHAGGNGHGTPRLSDDTPGDAADAASASARLAARADRGVTVDMPTGSAEMRDTAEQVVFARDLSLHDSAAVSANVVGDLAMDKSAMVVGQIQGSARLTDSAATVLITKGPVDIAGGLGGIVITPELIVRDGGSVLFTQREAAVFGAVFAAVAVVGAMLVRLLLPRR